MPLLFNNIKHRNGFIMRNIEVGVNQLDLRVELDCISHQIIKQTRPSFEIVFDNLRNIYSNSRIMVKVYPEHLA